MGLVPANGSPVHLTIPAGRRLAARPGVVVHRSRTIAGARHPVLEPPRTRVEETVIDLTQTSRDLDGAVGWLIRAVAARRTTPARLLATMAARHRVRWRRELTDALSDVADGCHSLLELRYSRQVERAHGLPRGRAAAPPWRPVRGRRLPGVPHVGGARREGRARRRARVPGPSARQRRRRRRCPRAPVRICRRHPASVRGGCRGRRGAPRVGMGPAAAKLRPGMSAATTTWPLVGVMALRNHHVVVVADLYETYRVGHHASASFVEQPTRS